MAYYEIIYQIYGGEYDLLTRKEFEGKDSDFWDEYGASLLMGLLHPITVGADLLIFDIVFEKKDGRS